MKNILTLIFAFLSLLCSAQSFKLSKNPTFGRTLKEGSSANGKKKEYITVNYLALQKLEKELSAKKNDYENTLNTIDFSETPLTDDQIKAAQDKVDLVKKSTLDLKKRIAFYQNLYEKEKLHHEQFTFGFWNNQSKALFQILYGNGSINPADSSSVKRFSLINNAGFSIGNQSGSVYTELVSGQLYIFRVSLGALVSSSNEESIDDASVNEAVQRLATSGGNTVLKFEYPIMYAHARNNQWTVISRFIGKGTADFAEFGTKTDDWAGSGSFGLDLYADIATSNHKLRFFLDANINQIYGTDTFNENLAIDNSGFMFGQLKLGLVFNQNISLSFIVTTFSSEASLRNQNVIANGQILN